MLLSRHSHYSTGKLSVIALGLVLGTLLSACSFSPLYGQRAGTDHTVEQHLALISIQPIKDRIGQDLRNNLLVRLNLKGQAASPLYSLNVTLEETISNLGIKKSAVVTRGNLKLFATFTLSQAANAALGIKSSSLITSTITTISSYDIPQAQYSALAALKDARARAVKEIANDMRTRLGVYFRQRPQ